MHYLLNIIQPDGPAPEPEVLEPIMAGLAAFNDELRAAGSWVFSAGLQPASSATVVRHDDGATLLTDGPFAEGKEHVGGFWVIQADDLDAALAWAGRAAAILTIPVEVRPMVNAQFD